MPDPVSITASILGIAQGVAFLSSTIENIRSAPESIKNIQRQLQHLKPILSQLECAVDQKHIDTDHLGTELKSVLDSCDHACTEFSTSLGHWTRHSSEDETSVLDYTKYEAETSGSRETDDKESFTSEIERHKKMVQVSEKVCKKALDAVIIERTQQNISDVCAAEESTALAGKFNVDGSDVTGQDITKVHAENRSFAVAGMANNFDFTSFVPKR